MEIKVKLDGICTGEKQLCLYHKLKLIPMNSEILREVFLILLFFSLGADSLYLLIIS